MIAVVDSGGANIASVLFALERLNAGYVFTADPDVIQKASHVLLPGVGTAHHAMTALNKTDGLAQCIKNLKQPVMGICLGMQLLFEYSQEGETPLLSIIKGRIEKFKTQVLTVPHMGWNTIEKTKQNPLLDNIDNGSYFYFVHSYRADVSKYTITQTLYDDSFSSIVAHDNFYGCQFHPERSGKAGEQLLKNFMRL
jgi:glutamine amidotransferase